MREIGSRGWFYGEARWAIHGTVDSVLRLFEQGCISRSKCREVLKWATGYEHGEPLPRAPWDELNWAPEEIIMIKGDQT